MIDYIDMEIIDKNINITINMKKWDDDCRLRNYVTKILNAKPAVQ